MVIKYELIEITHLSCAELKNVFVTSPETSLFIELPILIVSIKVTIFYICHNINKLPKLYFFLAFLVKS